ncbi:MAG: diguanylate cyclase [Pseudomonadota bacterium]|nr:diguanylate cyclase [Pseudomonadota bacterium]
MLSTSIFSSGYNVLFGVLSLFLGIASVFLVRTSKEFRGLFLFQLGGLFVVLITYLTSNEHVLYKVGLNFNFVAFVEMILALLASVIWINAAAELQNNQPANREMLAVYLTACLTIGLYFTFLNYSQKDANLFNSIMALFGLSLLLLVTIFRSVEFFNLGNLLLFCSVFMLWGKLIVSAYFFTYSWLNLNIFNWFWIYIFTAAVIFTKIHQQQTDLQKSWNMIDKLNLQFTAMIDSSPFPIVISKITGDRLLLINHKAGELFGITKKECAYFKLEDFFVDTENRRSFFETLEKNHEVQDFDLMVCNLINSSPFWLSVSAKTIEYNNEMALYMAFQNITLRKARESSLMFQAERDPLTMAWNRRYFEKNVPEKIKKSLQNLQNFSLLMIDADKFKNINDTYGHKAGDKVLTELVACCQNDLREDDIVCRYGGEEFMIFLDNTNTQSARAVAERLRQSIANLEVEGEQGEKIRFTVSIGVVSSEKTASLDVLLRQVDDATYLAKDRGRNRVEIYDEQLVKQIMKKKTPDQKRNIHPVFQNEENEEISLLDNYENKIL